MEFTNKFIQLYSDSIGSWTSSMYVYIYTERERERETGAGSSYSHYKVTPHPHTDNFILYKWVTK